MKSGAVECVIGQPQQPAAQEMNEQAPNYPPLTKRAITMGDALESKYITKRIRREQESYKRQKCANTEKKT